MERNGVTVLDYVVDELIVGNFVQAEANLLSLPPTGVAVGEKGCCGC